MRAPLAIGMLCLAGCSSQAYVIDDMENECESTLVTRSNQQSTYYTETYQCSDEPVQDHHRFFSQESDMAMIAIEGPL